MKSFLVILEQTARIYRRYFLIFIGIVAWILFPGALRIFSSYLLPDPFSFIFSWIFLVLEIGMTIWISIILLFLFFSINQKKSVRVSHLFSKALHLLPRFFHITIIKTIATFGGFLLLIVPGFICSVWFAFAEITFLFEKKQGLQALTQSKELVRGRFWPITWRLLAGTLFLFFIYLIILGLLEILFIFMLGLPEDGLSPILEETLALFVDLFTLPLFSGFIFLLYEEVRQTKSKGTNI